ncbi:hypothetical protein HRbin29_02116 [bacterium HR29]|jgi:hypothetical protein|nr:hypothetical protein HRbin29_02116 [bacterium HR29]
MSGVLHELGLDQGEDRVLLIEPPDAVLAEAGRVSPRPAVASSVHTARPARRIVWWPEPDTFEPGTLSRLRWLAVASGAVLWVIADAAAGLDGESVAERLRAAGFATERKPLAAGEAVRAAPR